MEQRRQHSFKPLPRYQRGAVLILVVVAMAAILMMAALALDGGHMLMNKARLQNAVDAAALSGAKTLSRLEGDKSDDCFEAEKAALATFTLNARAPGNEELLKAMGTGDDAAAAFVVVKFAPKVVEGPFKGFSSCNEGTPGRYVQVSVPSYGLAGFFWGFVQKSLGAKSVAAIATAGPSPTSPCDLAPLVVCAKSDDPDTGWGFGFGELEVLKTAAGNDSSIGPGNFQLLDFGPGAKTVGELMAGGDHVCPTVEATVDTKPGNTVGQSVKGLNTRFGIYTGNFSTQAEGEADSETLYPSDYPPDWVVDYTKVEKGKGKGLEQGVLALNDDGNIVYDDSPNESGKTNSTDLVEYYEKSKKILADSGAEIDGYEEWLQQSAACIESGSNCPGVFGRRILRVVIGDCPAGSTDGGTSTLKVLGFGCYFVLQPADQSGNSAQIFGQFVETCEGDGVPGPNPATDNGPEIIQLYKTYVDGSPNSDS